MARLNRSKHNSVYSKKGVLRRTLFFALLAVSCGSASASIEISSNTIAISGPQPIGEFGKEWASSLHPETDSFGQTEIAIDYVHKSTHWRFSRTRLIHSQPSSDTTRFYHAEKNNTPLVAGERFDLDLAIQQVDYSRLSAGKHFSFNQGKSNWRVNVGFLLGHEFLDGKLNGEAVAIDDKDYDFDFAIDYQYTDDPLFERPIDDPIRGFGLSVDISLEQQLSDYAALHININNVLSGLWWSDAGQTVGAASSDRKNRDSEGFVTFDPVFRGRESNGDFVHALPVLAKATLVRQIGERSHLQFQTQHTPAATWFALGTGRRIGAFTLSGEWIPAQGALGIAVSSKNFALRFVSDNLILDDAHHLEINAHYGFVF